MKSTRLRACAALGVTVACVTASAPAGAALIIHFDPNDASTLFQDGGTSAGSVPVTGVGDPVGWITDVRSSTPGGGSTDGFVDAQQANAGVQPTLVNSPGGTVLSFDGGDNLLGFDTDLVDIDGVGGALDTDTATLILVGLASSLGSGIDQFTGPDTGSDAFGLRYFHNTGVLAGYIGSTDVAATALATDELFVATLVWDGPGGSATLRLTTSSGTTTSVDAAAPDGPIDHDRFRLGFFLTGLVGDVYVYNDIADHSEVHDALAASYVPEPSTVLLLGGGLLGLTVRARRRPGKSAL